MSASPHASASLGDLSFLSTPPEPVGHPTSAPAEDRLAQSVADRLLQLHGVQGAWIERDKQGQRVVVLHYGLPGQPSHLPSQVQGMPTRIVGGEPIRAF